jgi:heme a synthase
MKEMYKGQKAVANWIFIGVAMLLVQVLLGGITRLTGSGLSITEWNVVTGALPPLNEAAWQQEFLKYQQTPQYQLLNSDFTLRNFKFIFFWEWFHRFWARLIGVVFIVGFVYLLAKRYLKTAMIQPLLILFVMGALQGAIGWIMVASGLTGDAVYVKPTKLALHFVFALVLISYAWWFALALRVKKETIVYHKPVRKLTWVIIAVLFLQLVYGALMAGHKAANTAATWPTINGDWLPANMFSPLLHLVDNKITVHFIHRGLAYLLVALTLLWTFKARNITTTAFFNKVKLLPLLFIGVQLLLGIFSVLTSTGIVANKWGMFEWMAQLHQLTGMLYLLVMVAMLYLVRKQA